MTSNMSGIKQFWQVVHSTCVAETLIQSHWKYLRRPSHLPALPLTSSHWATKWLKLGLYLYLSVTEPHQWDTTSTIKHSPWFHSLVHEELQVLENPLLPRWSVVPPEWLDEQSKQLTPQCMMLLCIQWQLMCAYVYSFTCEFYSHWLFGGDT